MKDSKADTSLLSVSIKSLNMGESVMMSPQDLIEKISNIDEEEISGIIYLTSTSSIQFTRSDKESVINIIESIDTIRDRDANYIQ
tara:strand:+ start:748 stop:1002 length:255 start_codon:yes stop_codon:yes gene_type:complete